MNKEYGMKSDSRMVLVRPILHPGVLFLVLSLTLLMLGETVALAGDRAAGEEPKGHSTSLDASSTHPYGFQYFVGIVGSPSKPDTTWTDDALKAIKSLGVNTLQLSIAWGGRPGGEVLNMEDLTPAQLVKWQHRVSQAKKFGFAAVAQFGVPQIHYASAAWAAVQPACLLDPAIREKYTRLLGEFLDKFPTVDHVLFYTYDQDSWQCSEFGPCPRCTGVPLDQRLSGFLNLMNDVMQKHHPGSTLWWKPWEISNGQVAKMLHLVNPEHFGIILNPSCANEVYPFNDRAFASDLGIKRAVQIAADRKIPVIGEFEYSFYKDWGTISDFFPRFVYENLQGWKQMKGVVGIKEYFGFAPQHFSVNAAMVKACIENPDASLDELLKIVAAPYGKKAAPHMMDAWEKVARGLEAMPWNASPGTLHGVSRNGDGSHPWEQPVMPGATWETPSWKTNRRANFMLTDESRAHPWVFEDIGLRLEDGGDLLFEAVDAYDKAIAAGSEKLDDIRAQRDLVAGVARSVRGRALHILETLATHEARLVGSDPKQYAIVCKRLENLLVRDLENQRNAAPMAEKLESFRKDPKKWVDSNFFPAAYSTNCLIDWNRFETPVK